MVTINLKLDLPRKILLRASWNAFAKYLNVLVHHIIATFIAALILAFGPASSVFAGEFELGAAFGLEGRAFPKRPRLSSQFKHFQPSISLEGDVRWENDTRTLQAVFVPFLRADSQDDKRSHSDISEAYIRYIGDEFDFLVGLGKVFWGVTESRHLIDIINQENSLEGTDGEDKLGQPMIKLSLFQDWGQLDMFVMSGFRERAFPGASGRLRGDLLVDGDDALFESPAAQGHVDLAARYSNYFSNVDMSLSVFHGTSREPRFALNATGTALRPIYSQITQVGLAIQYTSGAALWKLEAIRRDGYRDAFVAVSGGVEYTLYQIAESDWDLGLLAEFHYDGRESFSFTGSSFASVPIPFETPAPLTPYDEDLFIGARLGANDMQDSAILGGAVIDVNDGSVSIFIEAERRLGQDWTVELEGRFFANVNSLNTLSSFKNDGFLTLRITKHF